MTYVADAVDEVTVFHSAEEGGVAEDLKKNAEVPLVAAAHQDRPSIPSKRRQPMTNREQ